MKDLPKVILIGNTNVGKSTLFNRLIEQPKALTSPTAGTTRDILTGQVYWQGINFELLDTGGVETILPTKSLKKLAPNLSSEFAADIIKKTHQALKKTDLILFIVDLQAGLLPQDKELNKSLKKLNKKIILVANKADNLRLRDKVAEFYKLGLGEPFLVSAQNGLGTGDLLDQIVIGLRKIKRLRKGKKAEIKKAIKISLIGKPNVGKSSLLNALLGEERFIVSPIPLTTREAIDTYLEYKNQNIILVDTAGIRKQAKIINALEKASVNRSLSNAKNSDLCLLMLDISEPITVQDSKLSQILIESKASIIIIANKWDVIEEKEIQTQNDFKKYIYRNLPHLSWAPVLFVSAKTHQNVHRVLDLALQVYEARQIKISENALSKFLKTALKKHKPSQAKGTQHPYLSSLRQIKTNPPEFAIHIRQTDTLNPAYLKYLAKALREKFNLLGAPIKLRLKS